MITTGDTPPQIVPLVAGEEVGKAGFFGRSLARAQAARSGWRDPAGRFISARRRGRGRQVDAGAGARRGASRARHRRWSRASPAAAPARRRSASCCWRRARSAGEPQAEALLFAAARADHVEKTIRPALEAGHWVLMRPVRRQLARLPGRRRRPRHRDGAGDQRVRHRRLLPDRTLVLTFSRRAASEPAPVTAAAATASAGGRTTIIARSTLPSASSPPRSPSGFSWSTHRARPMRSPRACSPQSRTCCRDRRPGQGRRAVRFRLGDRGSFTMPGCSRGPRASARRASRARRHGAYWPMPPARRSTCRARSSRRPSDRQAGRGRKPSRHALARAAGEGEGRRISPATSRSIRCARSGEFMAHDGGAVAVAGRGDRQRRRSRTRRAPTLSSRCSRSRRPTRCSSWSAMRPGDCCRRSGRAAGVLQFSRRSTMTP